MMIVVAFLGYYTVATDIYYETFHINNSTQLSYEPYIYCFIVYFLLFFPLRNLKFAENEGDFLFGKNGRLFIRYWVIFYTFFTLLKMYEAMGGLAMGLGNVYEARHIDGESLYRYDNLFLDNRKHPFLNHFYHHSLNQYHSKF